MLFKRDKSVGVSLAENQILHGVEIKKVPVGKYIQALKKAEDLPGAVLSSVFPDMNIDDIINSISGINRDEVIVLFGRLLTTAPEIIVDTMCSIIGIDSEFVLDELTPKEFLDVCQAFWKLNDLSDFFANVWRLIKPKLSTLTTGYKNG